MATATKTREEWRTTFIEYYTTNAPSKVNVVTDSFLDKWEGKFDKLWIGITKKYGEPGFPIVPPPAKKKGPPLGRGRGRGGPPRSRGGPKPTIAENHDVFVNMIQDATATATTKAVINRPELSLVVTKQHDTTSNGLETSTFTVCSRIRPVLDHEKNLGGENFPCVFPGPPAATGNAAAAAPHTENVLILAPEFNFRGEPSLKNHNFTLDYAFNEKDSEQEIYDTVAKPLVSHALEGRTGVIFAYGQTGSGKTHTMNHIMDRVATQLSSSSADKTITFQYLELQGKKLTDTLRIPAGEC